MNLFIQLFLQFFHVGVFSFGGGYATLPFLYDIAEKYHWYSAKQLTDMLAISSITPGPIGVNVATFGLCFIISRWDKIVIHIKLTSFRYIDFSRICSCKFKAKT